jgi:MFS transporter, PPP family, 3-phenylpropionic acid transporter
VSLKDVTRGISMDSKKIMFKLNALYFVVFGTIACFYPFLAVYLQQRGLTYTQIGVVFAANSVAAVLCQPIWGYITDKYLNKKLTMLITLSVSGILVLLFIAAKGFYFILLTIIIFMLFQGPVTSVNDAYCFDVIESNKKLQFGRFRLMGSIGYALVALGLGVAIKVTNINIVFVIFCIFSIIAVVILYGIRYDGHSSGCRINIADIVSVLKSKQFIVLTISAMIINASQNANGNYIAVLIENTGGDVSKLGLVWFIIAACELPAFYLGNKILKKYGALNVYCISLLFYSLRFLLDGVSSSYYMVLTVQILQAVTFPLYLMATMQYINVIASPETRTSTITAFNAFAGGAGGIIGNIGGGVIIQYYGIFYLFKIMAVLSLLSLAVILLIKRDSKIKITVKCK